MDLLRHPGSAVHRIPRFRGTSSDVSALASTFVFSLALPMAAVAAMGCRASEATVSAERPADSVSHTLRFHARMGEQPFGCSDTYTLHGIEVQPTDLRLFISEVELLRPDGEAVPLTLDEVPGWQTRNVALLDFENGSGACVNGTPDTRYEVSGYAPPGPVRGVRFTIGVPFEVNHADPARAEGPLSLTSLHWGWQAGYKFLTAGLRGEGLNWQVHLGSTACQGPATNVSGCDHPNRARIELGTFDIELRSIPLQVDALVAAETLASDAPREARNGCMAEVEDPGCEPVFRGLGLDAAGASTNHLPPFLGVR